MAKKMILCPECQKHRMQGDSPRCSKCTAKMRVSIKECGKCGVKSRTENDLCFVCSNLARKISDKRCDAGLHFRRETGHSCCFRCGVQSTGMYGDNVICSVCLAIQYLQNMPIHSRKKRRRGRKVFRCKENDAVSFEDGAKMVERWGEIY